MGGEMAQQNAISEHVVKEPPTRFFTNLGEIMPFDPAILREDRMDLTFRGR